VSFAAVTFCVSSQQVFIVVSVHFVIDSVRKLLDKPTYIYVGNSRLQTVDVGELIGTATANHWSRDTWSAVL
jgi:hypothetical protein